MQREEGMPVEKDTLAKDLPSDLVQIVNVHDMKHQYVKCLMEHKVLQDMSTGNL